MPFFVYIIFSERLTRFYTGTTDDVDRRLQEHNNALYIHSFTSKGIPWSLFLNIECNSSEQAYKLERFIKAMKSSAFIRQLKDNPSVIEDLLKRFT